MSDPKATLRQSVSRDVARLTSLERSRKSAQIMERVFNHPLFENARTVLAYDSTEGEVNTQTLLARCIERTSRVTLPRMEKKTRGLFIHSVTNLNALEATRFGFREPPADSPQIAASEIDWVIVPGVAFDVHGNRLGRGGGYYDRFLARSYLKAVRCALAFECQIVPDIPCLPHDRGVEFIFTENRILNCKQTIPNA